MAAADCKGAGSVRGGTGDGSSLPATVLALLPSLPTRTADSLGGGLARALAVASDPGMCAKSITICGAGGVYFRSDTPARSSMRRDATKLVSLLCTSLQKTTWRMPLWITSFAHSLHGNSAT